MDDNTLNMMIANDKEWRTYMIRSMENIQKQNAINAKDIAMIKTWGRIWRIIGTSVLSIMIYAIRDIIFK